MHTHYTNTILMGILKKYTVSNQKVIILFIIKVHFFILSQRHLKTFISIQKWGRRFNTWITTTSWDPVLRTRRQKNNVKTTTNKFFSSSHYLKFNEMNKFYDFWSFVSSIVNFLSIKSTLNPRKYFIGAFICVEFKEYLESIQPFSWYDRNCMLRTYTNIYIYI